jgi:hypothetical protein
MQERARRRVREGFAPSILRCSNPGKLTNTNKKERQSILRTVDIIKTSSQLPADCQPDPKPNPSFVPTPAARAAIFQISHGKSRTDKEKKVRRHLVRAATGSPCAPRSSIVECYCYCSAGRVYCMYHVQSTQYLDIQYSVHAVGLGEGKQCKRRGLSAPP